MMNGKLKTSQTFRLPGAAICIATLTLASMVTTGASAQEWPFSDAPEPITSEIQQTSGSDGTYPAPPQHGGVIMSADALDLGPGETVIGGDPVLRQSGIIASPSQPQLGSKIPYRSLHHSGRGPQRRPRDGGRFGPQECQECMWGCPQGCAPTAYGGFEGLLIDRNEDTINFSRNLFPFLADEYMHGVRVTFGRMCNCSDGYEFTYTGMLEWEQRGLRNDATGQLNFRPGTVAPVLEADLPGFYETNTQSQRFNARYTSYEANHREWGWDVISTVAGLRVIDYNEEFVFQSIDDNGGPFGGAAVGQFHQDINNLLIGGQLGLDLLYPVCRRVMIGSRIRGSLLANFMEIKTNVTDSTVGLPLNPPLVRDITDEIDIAGMIESGFFVSYHFMPCLSVKVGYEAWYLLNVATINDQYQSTVGANYSASGNTSDVYFHGATAGVEVLF